MFLLYFGQMNVALVSIRYFFLLEKNVNKGKVQHFSLMFTCPREIKTLRSVCPELQWDGAMEVCWATIWP